MKFIFTSIFLGSLLILWGLSLVIEAIFGVSLPIIKIAFALLLIYGGFLLIKGIYPSESQKTIFFSKEQTNTLFHEYKIVLGEGKIDLSQLSLDYQEKVHLKIYTLLGNCILTLNPKIPTIIHANSVLAAVNFPDRTMVSFGSYSYEPQKNAGAPLLVIDATAVLGALEVKNS